MRLIDSDWVLEHIKPYELSDENWSVTGGTAIRLIYNAIDRAPTIDAVPVVRCKDCEYFRLNDENVPYCLNPFDQMTMNQMDFAIMEQGKIE